MVDDTTLGLTPASRARLKVDPKRDESKVAFFEVDR